MAVTLLRLRPPNPFPQTRLGRYIFNGRQEQQGVPGRACQFPVNLTASCLTEAQQCVNRDVSMSRDISAYQELVSESRAHEGTPGSKPCVLIVQRDPAATVE
jgi:hypothetical protein